MHRTTLSSYILTKMKKKKSAGIDFRCQTRNRCEQKVVREKMSIKIFIESSHNRSPRMFSLIPETRAQEASAVNSRSGGPKSLFISLFPVSLHPLSRSLGSFVPRLMGKLELHISPPLLNLFPLMTDETILYHPEKRSSTSPSLQNPR